MLQHSGSTRIDSYNRDNNGMTSLMLTSELGHNDVVKLLLEYSNSKNIDFEDKFRAFVSISNTALSKMEYFKLGYEEGNCDPISPESWETMKTDDKCPFSCTKYFSMLA